MDDLLDLNWSTTPSSQPQSAKQPAGRSTFDYLSSATLHSPASSSLNSRSASPFSSSSSSTTTPAPTYYSTQPQRPITPLASTAGSNTRPSPATSGGGATGGDAFSSLFGNTASTSSNGNGTGLSMAERLNRDRAQSSSSSSSSGFGIGMGGAFSPSSSSLGTTTSRSASPALLSPTIAPLPPARPSSSLSSTARKTPSPVPSIPTSSRGQYSSSTTKPPPPLQPKVADPWDFDLLSTSTPAPPPSQPPSSTSTSKATPTFSFDSSPPLPPTTTFEDTSFDRSKSLLSQLSDSDSDSDFLGALSKPVSSLPRPSPSASSRPPTTSSRLTQAPSRTSSPPPPHILGSLITMGFSIPQSIAALEATKGVKGWDVEAATEVLVEEQRVEDRGMEEREGRREAERISRSGGEEEEGRRSGKKKMSSFKDSDEEDEPVRERESGRRRVEREKESRRPQSEEGSTDPTKLVQEQASVLLSQASKLGFSVFKSANAYWETGRAIATKKLKEEGFSVESIGKGLSGVVAGVSGGGGGGGEKKDGRPRWMQDAGFEEGGVEEVGGTGGFRDGAEERAKGKKREEGPTSQPPPPTLFQDSEDEDDGVLQPHPSERRAPPPSSTSFQQRPTPLSSRQPPQQQPSPPVVPPSTEYKSPWRRGKSTPSSSVTPTPSPTPPPRLPPSRTITPTPPKPKITRPSIPVSSTQLTTSTNHKNTGNEHFKLGRFGDAETSYSSAIEVLPEKSLVVVPLLNNRAAARLKNGNEKDAIEDCTLVISILLLEGKILVAELEEEEEGVKVREQLGKALGKRAKGWEGREKWDEAEKDWRLLEKVGVEGVVRGAGGLKVVGEGLGRCRKAKISGGGGGEMRATPIPTRVPTRPRPSPTPSTSSIPANVDTSTAVAALRSAASAQESEDDLKLSLKDSVDSRILNWKGGKENNLRALIASLDSVLWEELKWKKVGMHELISEGQVKKQYVGAIGRLHPDKLNVGNTTVEQRMIAGGVFAGLNDAWNASRT